MKILFCSDGSNLCYEAINNFTNWFKKFDADILCVANIHTLPEGFVLEIPEFESRCQNSVKEILNHSKDHLDSLKIETKKLIKGCGGTVDYILETEKKGKYDYIVLGSNGKIGIQKWLGSISQEVASKCKSSIYISKGKNNLRDITFAFNTECDYSPELEKMITEINFGEKNIHLITVFKIPEYMFLEGNIDKRWIKDIEKKQIKLSLNKLAHYERIFRQHNIKITNSLTIKGNYEEEILKYSKNNKIDLIVCPVYKQNNNKTLPASFKKILEHCSTDIIILKDFENL